MAGTLGSDQLMAVARLFSVLAEPTRLALLQELRSAPRAVGELVERLGAKQANVSKQLGVLHVAGLVGRERVGASVLYQIADPVVFELCDLVCGKIRRDAERQLAGLVSSQRR